MVSFRAEMRRNPSVDKEGSRASVEITEVSSPPISEELKKRWSHPIRKVYKIVPFVSPKCSGK